MIGLEKYFMHFCFPRKANKILKLETEMFQCSFNKIEPCRFAKTESNARTLTTPSAGEIKSNHSSELTTCTSKLSSRGTRSNTRSTAHHHFEKLLKLRAEDKCDIAQKEFERLKELRKKHVEDSERVVNHFKAIIEEASERTSDLKKEYNEFDRDIAKGSVNHRSGKVYGERVIRNFEDKMKAKSAYVSKMRLRSQALRQRNKKLAMMLKQKKEIGDILTEIDFQQLKMENAERIEKIEERNKDFFRLKTNSTVTVHILNDYKKRLHKLSLESAQLEQDISSRNLMLSRLENEASFCEIEKVKAQEVNKKHRKNLAMYKVPEVMEAVSQRSEVVSLTQNVSVWERKLKIAEMALTTQKKRWSRIKIEAGEGHSAIAQLIPST